MEEAAVRGLSYFWVWGERIYRYSKVLQQNENGKGE
jgi:hypothetical protein